MPSRTRVLLALLLAAEPLAAAEPPFTTELAVGFGYEGSSADRPLVVLDGTPSKSYDYSADGSGHTVEVSATRWLAPVGDDGRTPLALLPYVARASSVSARYALTGASRDSVGRFAGQETTLEVSVAGDSSLREAGLSAEWFVTRDVAVLGGFAYETERSTDASVSLESPSGRADVSTAGTSSSTSSGSLGVSLRLGEHEVRVSGSYGVGDLTRDDASAFTGSAQPSFATLTSEGVDRSGTLSSRLLFLDRRLAADVSLRYARSTSSADLETTFSGPFSEGSAVSREAGVEATWFVTRQLGLSAGFVYGTRDVDSGPPGRPRPSQSEIDRVFSVRVRWFASGRVSAELRASRSESDAIAPPDSSTYQRFEEVVDRVTLGAVVRF